MSNSWEFGFDFSFTDYLWSFFLSLSFSPLFPLAARPPRHAGKAFESLDYLTAFLLLTPIND